MFCYYSVFGHESQNHFSPLDTVSSRMPLPSLPILFCFVGFVGIRYPVCIYLIFMVQLHTYKLLEDKAFGLPPMAVRNSTRHYEQESEFRHEIRSYQLQPILPEDLQGFTFFSCPLPGVNFLVLVIQRQCSCETNMMNSEWRSQPTQ